MPLDRGGRDDEAVEQAAGDLGCEQGVAGHHGADPGDELLRRGALEQEAAGAGPDRVVDVVVEVEGCEHEDLRAGIAAEQVARGLEPVELGHPDVHQHEVRRELARALQRLAPVGGLADHLEVGLRVEDHPQAAAHERLIVGDQDPDGLAHACIRSASIARAGARGMNADTANPDPPAAGAA